jgi:hypothetical protein
MHANKSISLLLMSKIYLSIRISKVHTKLNFSLNFRIPTEKEKKDKIQLEKKFSHLTLIKHEFICCYIT